MSIGAGRWAGLGWVAQHATRGSHLVLAGAPEMNSFLFLKNTRVGRRMKNRLAQKQRMTRKSTYATFPTLSPVPVILAQRIVAYLNQGV